MKSYFTSQSAAEIEFRTVGNDLEVTIDEQYFGYKDCVEAAMFFLKKAQKLKVEEVPF